MRPGKIVEKAADAPAADDAVKAVIDLGIDGDGELLHVLRYVLATEMRGRQQ
jgi:hypothetical protein